MLAAFFIIIISLRFYYLFRRRNNARNGESSVDYISLFYFLFFNCRWQCYSVVLTFFSSFNIADSTFGRLINVVNNLKFDRSLPSKFDGIMLQKLTFTAHDVGEKFWNSAAL